MSRGGGIPGNIQALMQQAKKMQADLQKAQDHAKQIEIEEAAGGGMVKVKVNGEKQILSIELNSSVVNPNDIKFLEELIKDAVNKAINAVQVKINSELGKITGGLNIPGLF